VALDGCSDGRVDEIPRAAYGHTMRRWTRRSHRAVGSAAALLAAGALLAAVAFAAKPGGDTTPPTVTLTTPVEGSTTTDTTPTFAGTAGTARTDLVTVDVLVYAGSSATGSPLQTLTASRAKNGGFSVAATSPLAGGTYTARARQADKAGNVGLSSPRGFQVVTGGGGNDPVIAAAGDIACDPGDASFNGGAGTPSACRQLATSALLTDGTLDRVLTLGDNQYETGTLSAYRGSYDLSWGAVKSITRPAVGNHEYGTAGAAGHFDYFNGVGVADGPAGDRTKGYYSFDVGTWHVIAVNSNCSSIGGCGVSSVQEQWLRSDLAAHPSSCTLAYWHHPRFSSGSHGNSAEMAPIWQALYDANADVVLVGHDHNYERFGPQDAAGTADAARGLREFVVGTGGKTHYATGTPKPNSEVRNSDTFGVLKLTLHPSGYDWRFQPAVGSFSDLGSASCH
jgi:hypothetical protein